MLFLRTNSAGKTLAFRPCMMGKLMQVQQVPVSIAQHNM